MVIAKAAGMRQSLHGRVIGNPKEATRFASFAEVYALERAAFVITEACRRASVDTVIKSVLLAVAKSLTDAANKVRADATP